MTTFFQPSSINQPSYISTMLYSSLISRSAYYTPEAGPSTTTTHRPLAGRRLASPLRPVAASDWSSDDGDASEAEDDDDDDDDDMDFYYRGRSTYQRPVPFMLPTDPTAHSKTPTVLPLVDVKSPNATSLPIALPPSPLQLPTTTGPLFPDRPSDFSLVSIRALSVDSSSPSRSSSPAPAPLTAEPSSSRPRRSSSVESSGSGSSTDWDAFSDDDEDGLSSPALFDCDESVVIRRNSEDDAVLNTLQFARKPSLGLPKSPPPTYSFSLPSSWQPDIKELSFLSTSLRSRSFRTDNTPA